MLALDAQAVGGAGPVEDMLHHVVHIPGGGGLDDFIPLQGVVHQGDLLAVHQLGNLHHSAGALVDAVVGEDGVGLGHITDVGAVGKTAHSQGGGDVGLPFALNHPARLQLDVVTVLDKFKALFRGDIVVHQADSHRVQRPHQGLADGEMPPVVGGTRVQGPGLTPQHLIGVVVQHGVGADLVELQGGGVDGQGLEGGAGLPVAVIGVVAAQVDGLFPKLAGYGQQVARLILNDGDGRLHLSPVPGGIVQIIPVCVYLIYNGLDIGVVAGVNAQAAPLEGQLSPLIGPLELVRHDLLYIRDDRFFIPGVCPAGALALVLDKDQLLSYRLVILLPGDILLLQHLVEDDLLPVLIPLPAAPNLLGVEALGAGEGVGAVSGGVVGNSDETGTLGQSELRHRLAEVALSGRPHPLVLPALKVASQRDGVQVVGDGVLLGVVLGEAEGSDNFGDFPLDSGFVVVGLVFNELLGDGGAAGNLLAGEHGQHGPACPPPVHAGVGPEAPVLNGHGGVNQVLGNLLKVHPHRAGQIVQLGHLHILPGVLVLVVHDAVLIEDKVVRAQVSDGDNDVVDVYRGEAANQRAGTQPDENEGADGLKNPADHPAHGDTSLLLFPSLFGGVRRLTASPGGCPVGA